MAVDGPGTLPGYFFLGTPRALRGQDDLFHHLADDAVGEYHGRVAPAEGQLEGQVDEVGHLLHRGRCEHDGLVVAVASAHGGLQIVALAGLYGAQAWASALHVDDQGGYFAHGHVRHALLHQGHAGARRGCHDAFAAAAASVEHVDGGHFAFGLQHDHAGGLPRLQQAQRFEYLRLGCDGVAEESVAAAAYGGVGDGFVAFQQHIFVVFHGLSVLVRYMVMHPSGHTTPQAVHPVQRSSSCCTT